MANPVRGGERKKERPRYGTAKVRPNFVLRGKKKGEEGKKKEDPIAKGHPRPKSRRYPEKGGGKRGPSKFPAPRTSPPLWKKEGRRRAIATATPLPMQRCRGKGGGKGRGRRRTPLPGHPFPRLSNVRCHRKKRGKRAEIAVGPPVWLPSHQSTHVRERRKKREVPLPVVNHDFRDYGRFRRPEGGKKKKKRLSLTDAFEPSRASLEKKERGENEYGLLCFPNRFSEQPPRDQPEKKKKRGEEKKEKSREVERPLPPVQEGEKGGGKRRGLGQTALRHPNYFR